MSIQEQLAKALAENAVLKHTRPQAEDTKIMYSPSAPCPVALPTCACAHAHTRTPALARSYAHARSLRSLARAHAHARASRPCLTSQPPNVVIPAKIPAISGI